MPTADDDSEKALLPWEGDDVLPPAPPQGPYGIAGGQGGHGVLGPEELRRAVDHAVDQGGMPMVWTPASGHLQPAAAIPDLREPVCRWLRSQARERRAAGLRNLGLWGALGLFAWSLQPEFPPIILLILAFAWGLLPMLYGAWQNYRIINQPASVLDDLTRSVRWSWWSAQRRPEATRVLVIGLAIIAVLQLASAGGLTLGLTRPIASLAEWERAALLTGAEVHAGEWWRLLTGTLLHGGLIHIGFNAFFFWHIGGELEKLIGRWHLLAACLICGLGGSLASVWWNPEVFALGFSGSLCGLLGVQVGMALRYPRLPPGLGRLAFLNAGLLIGIGFIGASVIDNAGHAGGFLIGVVYGLLLFARRRALPLAAGPAAYGLGGSSALIYLAGAIWLLYLVFVRHPIL